MILLKKNLLIYSLYLIFVNLLSKHRIHTMLGSVNSSFMPFKFYNKLIQFYNKFSCCISDTISVRISKYSIRRDNKKKLYERRVYESVDDISLS